MGPLAGVYAGHATIIAASLMLVWRFVPLARNARFGHVDPEVLGHLALSAMLVAGVALVEAVYFAAARMLIHEGVDLWTSYPAVWILRFALAAVVVFHMPAYWRWRGYEGRALRLRIAIDVSALVGVWLAGMILLY